MFRKMIAALTIGAGLLGTAEFAPVQAAWVHHYRPIFVERPVVVVPAPVVVTPAYPSYTLYYRAYPTESWQVYRVFGEERLALDASARLRIGGFQVRIGR